MTDEALNVLNTMLEIQKNIDEIKDKYDDDELKDKITTVCYNAVVFKGKDHIEKYCKDQIDTDRNIRLGIVGRVKAGKSSLLNSLLFKGKYILPEAPTPMTAALTQIEYSDNNYIEIEFLTEEDIKLLEEQDKEYKKLFERVKNKLSKNQIIDDFILNKKTEEKIKSDELNEILIASSKIYNNFIKIKNTGDVIYREIIQDHIKEISFSNIDEIKNKLDDYVSSKGKYADFVKSLKLYINIDILKEISILDTPGFNDPLVTRNIKANQLLSKCDAILLLTPSTHNFSNSDIEAMNRITKKEGIQEIYIVISKFDDSLVSNNIVLNSGGDLDAAIDNILNDLCKNIKNSLENINRDGVFDKILSNNIEDSVTYSSGICANMAYTFDDRDKWYLEKNKNTVLNNLSEKYKDYFSQENIAKNSLEKLGNITKIKNILESVKLQKEAILKNNIKKIENNYKADILNIIDEIKKYIEERKKNIFNEDIKDKKSDLKKLLEISEKTKEKIDANYKEQIEEYIKNISRKIIEDNLSNLNKKLDDTIDKNINEIKGFFGNKYNANKIKIEKSLNDYSYDFNNSGIYDIDIVQLSNLISNFFIELLRKEIPSNTEINDFSIKSIIFDNFGECNNRLQIDETKKNEFFENYNKDIVLEKKEAEIFVNGVMNISKDYKNQAVFKIHKKIDNLKKDLKNIQFSDLILKKYIDKLNNDLKELDMKEEALKKCNSILKEVMNII